MWTSRTKTDLIIEVWEKLDCESVGLTEIKAIEAAVEGRFGKAAVPTPMQVARLLADEGAVVRHSEVMKLHVAQATDRPHDAPLRDIIDFSDLKFAARSLRNLENLRRRFETDDDREGLRLLRERVIAKKKESQELAFKRSIGKENQALAAEAAQWLTLWLQSPELFQAWLKMRLASEDFKERFGEV